MADDNLIPLQSAYIRQSIDARNNAWVMYDTKGNELYELPNTLSPEQAMSYLHFARGFELSALNIGIQFGKKEATQAISTYVDELKARIGMLSEQNVGLATQLEKFIIEGN